MNYPQPVQLNYEALAFVAVCMIAGVTFIKAWVEVSILIRYWWSKRK